MDFNAIPGPAEKIPLHNLLMLTLPTQTLRRRHTSPPDTHSPLPALPGHTSAPSPPSTSSLPIRSQHLRELALSANRRAFPIEQINRYSNKHANDREDGGRPREGVFTGEYFVEGRGIHGRNASEEVSGHAVAAGGGGGVRTIGGDHVVDGGHVDGVVCEADKGGEDHRCYPGSVVAWSERGPGEADEADGEERDRVEEPPEPGFGLEAVGVREAFFALRGDTREEGEVGYEVADNESMGVNFSIMETLVYERVEGCLRDESKASFVNGESPLLVHGCVGFEEGEDEGIAEAAQKGEAKDNGLAYKHFEWSVPYSQDFFQSNALPGHLIWAPDIRLTIFATALGFLV